METWEKPSSRRHHRKPSFSSTLLDQIYRSIDDDSPPLEPTRKKKLPHEDLETSPDKLVFHRRSVAADFERSKQTTTASAVDSVFLRYSNSTSSDSSGLSSSESDSFYGRSKPSPSPPQPKPIRTSGDVQRPNSKQELGGFLRTKSKALKIYTDLKKVKQPISPGGRLATFLNSLFTNASTNNPKKPKKNTTSNNSVLSGETQSSSTTCSSASSFSRSCLSKTPSSSGKSKRSVRFCPVNVILDEDSSVYIPCGNNNKNNYNDAKRYRHVMEEEENRRVIEAAKDLIRTYQKNKDLLAVTTCDEVEDDDDDDDAASYASSDLFELENLSAIGMERYQEELPVYETTRLDNSNRAIATSLIV